MLWKRTAEKQNGGPGTTAEEENEELDLETELAAFNAKLAVLQTCDTNKFCEAGGGALQPENAF